MGFLNNCVIFDKPWQTKNNWIITNVIFNEYFVESNADGIEFFIKIK